VLALQYRDGIPVHRELLLLNIVWTKRSPDITILHQTLGAPESNTEGCMRGLNCKPAADIRQNKTAMAEDTFNINSCSYMTNVSVPKINMIELSTHQELRGNCEPCVIVVEILHASHATTLGHPSHPRYLPQGTVGVHHSMRR
jgi:hypothetical protein